MDNTNMNTDTNERRSLWPGDPVRHEISNAKRYKAAARFFPDGEWVAVYSYAWPGRCSYGLQHWFDKDGEDYGQIDLVSPMVELANIEEMTDEEAAAVDNAFG